MKITKWLDEFARIWRIARKPTKEEVKSILKITGISILILGFIAYIIQSIFYLIFNFLK